MSLPEDATHFGMGSGQFPIAEPVLQQRLQKLGKEHKCYKRNGLRFLQKHCFQETTLVAPKLNQRLPAQRDKPCGEKHRGFCKQEVVDDDDEKVIFESMVAHLKKNEHMDRSGDVIYSFLIWRQQEEEIMLADRQYYQFMFFRGAPKYATTYARMDRIGTNENGLRLALEKESALPCRAAELTKHISVNAMSVEKAAKQLQTPTSKHSIRVTSTKQPKSDATPIVSPINTLELLLYSVSAAMVWSYMCAT